MCHSNNTPLTPPAKPEPLKKNNPNRVAIMRQRLDDVTSKKDGKCLGEYKNNRTSMVFECADGHQWEATPDSILTAGTWCPMCHHAKIKMKVSIEIAHEVAAKKGGKCLSTEYHRDKDKLLWECADGHQWWATLITVRGNTRKPNGTWCPTCAAINSSRGEEFARQALQLILGFAIPKYRPKWMGHMEYDGYSVERGFAFEYHGLHHRLPGIYPGRKLEDFQRIDEAKRIMAREHGVTLLELVSVQPNTRPEDWIQYAITEVRGIGLYPVCIDIDQIMRGISLPDCDTFRAVRAVIAKNGGKCLSHVYINWGIKIKVQNEHGYIWDMQPSRIIAGHWNRMKPGLSRRRKKKAPGGEYLQFAA
jgi:hypothetical protein